MTDLAAVLTGLTDPAVIVDADRRILDFNALYLEFAGMRRRALRRKAEAGLRCCDVSGLPVCRTECLATQALAQGSAIRLDEIEATPPGGEARTLIVAAIPVGADRVLKVYRDVTAEARIHRHYKVLLEQAERAKELLEQRVEQRTVALREANEELKKTQTMLIHQEKMSSLGRLVAGIAHELNNPISFIYGNVEFMADYLGSLLEFVERVTARGDLPPAVAAEIEELITAMEYDHLREDAPKLVRSIEVGAERSANIVKDLKLFSHHGPSAFEPADLVEAIESSLTILQPLLKSRVTIRWDREELPRVRCNIGHLNQVFMNILTNAAQAIDGEGEILIRTRLRPRGVRVLFRDSGPGIAIDSFDKIFEPFFTTKSVGEGTGLGLAICDGIVRRHRGQLMVESDPGRGATFIIDLPLDPDEAK